MNTVQALYHYLKENYKNPTIVIVYYPDSSKIEITACWKRVHYRVKNYYQRIQAGTININEHQIIYNKPDEWGFDTQIKILWEDPQAIPKLQTIIEQMIAIQQTNKSNQIDHQGQ
jgi:hypothetical protein